MSIRDFFHKQLLIYWKYDPVVFLKDILKTIKFILFKSHCLHELCVNCFIFTCSSTCCGNRDIRESHSNKREREWILHLHEQERQNYWKGMFTELVWIIIWYSVICCSDHHANNRSEFVLFFLATLTVMWM